MLGAAACALTLACSFDSGGEGEPEQTATLGETASDDGTSSDPTLTSGGPGVITAQPLDESGETGSESGEGPVDDWWDDSWTHRRRIEFIEPPENDLGTFPLLVYLDADNFPVDDLQPGGDDLRFVLTDGTQLSYEIERFNPVSTSVVWVALPGTTGSSLDLWVYWGNATANPESSGPAVFGPDYVALWHMAEHPIAAVADATGSGAVAFPSGMEAQDRVEGWVGNAWRFDGLDNMVSIPVNSGLDNSGGLMIEVWALIEDTYGDTVCRGADSGGEVFCIDVSNGTLRVTLTTDGDEGESVTYNDFTPVPAGEWVYLTLTWDALISELRLHVNGDLAGQKFHPGDTLGDSEAPITIGARSPAAFYFAGVLDELRVSRTPRPRAWIELQHRSMSDQLFEFGPTEHKN